MQNLIKRFKIFLLLHCKLAWKIHVWRIKRLNKKLEGKGYIYMPYCVELTDTPTIGNCTKSKLVENKYFCEDYDIKGIHGKNA